MVARNTIESSQHGTRDYCDGRFWYFYLVSYINCWSIHFQDIARLSYYWLAETRKMIRAKRINPAREFLVIAFLNLLSSYQAPPPPKKKVQLNVARMIE